MARLLKMECVVGENTGEACVESRVCLPVRTKKIADIQARLQDLGAEVVDGQVMVQGILHKQIFFVGQDDRIHHQPEDVPFCAFVEVPGAAPCNSAQVHGLIAKISHTLAGPHDLVQRAILQFFVKVTEDCQLEVVEDPTGPLVKADCVVGETVVACPVENISELDRPAIKIRDVRVCLEDICAEVAEDQVLFQGTLQKQIFFIANNNQEFHQEERVPFTGIAAVPCARPGDNVTIKPHILRVDRFLTNGDKVRQRVILSVLIKVTRPFEINVAADPTGPLVLAKRVIATACRQTLVENALELTVPAKKIQDIVARVQDLCAEVIPNKVIITGTLHKQIFFVGPDDVVHHQGEDISFTTFAELPGAQPWMTAQVLPKVEHISWSLACPLDPGDDDLLGRGSILDPYVPTLPECREQPLFQTLCQKVIIDILVRVSEDQQIRIRAVPVAPPTILPAVERECPCT